MSKEIMMRQKNILIVLACFLFSACSPLLEKDNSPPPSSLVPFTATFQPKQLWNNRVSYETNRDQINSSPVLTDTNIITVNSYGTIVVLDKNTGKTRWEFPLNTLVNSSPAVDHHLVVIAAKNGDVIALNLFNNTPLWRISAHNEILSAPAISDNLVIIKTIDGQLTALSRATGLPLWTHQELEPNLILRGASSPQVTQGSLIVGYANGRIVKLTLKNGQIQWSQPVATPSGAFAIQRMIDVDADPIISGNQVFAITYQGKIAAFNVNTGKPLWNQNISSYSNITVDEHNVYASDAEDNIWAFDRTNGRIVWKQTQLKARHITGPAMIDHYIVVGDAEGMLHWLNKKDGRFVARAPLGGTRILARPAAAENTLYVITQDGYLMAYR